MGKLGYHFVIIEIKKDFRQKRKSILHPGREHPLLTKKFADTIDRTYSTCSWMPDDRFLDAISYAQKNRPSSEGRFDGSIGLVLKCYGFFSYLSGSFAVPTSVIVSSTGAAST